MTLHLKSRGYPFRPRLLFSSFIVVGVGFPTVYYFRRGQFFICSLDNPRSPRRLVRFPPFPEILHQDVGKPTPYNVSFLLFKSSKKTIYCIFSYLSSQISLSGYGNMDYCGGRS